MKNPFNMQGRISRSRYCRDLFLVFMGAVVAAVVTGFTLGTVGATDAAVDMAALVITALAVCAQSVITVRRLHDLGKPGWHCWLYLVPLYNLYLGLVVAFTPGHPGENQYGSNPSAV